MRLFVFVCTLCFALPTVSAEENCDKILKAHNVTVLAGKQARSQDTSEELNYSWAEQKKRKSNTGGGMTIPVYGIPVRFDFSNSRDEKTYERLHLDYVRNEKISDESEVLVFQKVLPDAAWNAYRDCIRERFKSKYRRTVSLSLERKDNTVVATLEHQPITPGDNVPLRLTGVTVVGAEATGDLVFKRDAELKPYSSLTQAYSRQLLGSNCRSDLLLIINFDGYPYVVESCDALHPLPNPPAPEKRTIQLSQRKFFPPFHSGGDDHLRSRGPQVNASADLRISDDRRSLLLSLFMHAHESDKNGNPTGDQSTYEGKRDEIAWTCDDGIIASIETGKQSSSSHLFGPNKTPVSPPVAGDGFVQQFKFFYDNAPETRSGPEENAYKDLNPKMYVMFSPTVLVITKPAQKVSCSCGKVVK